MNEMKCENCKFFQPEGRECRRYPPQVWGDGHLGYGCAFPSVEKDEFCGEFKWKYKVEL